MATHTTIDGYVNDQPKEVAERLQTIRELFHKVLPDTKESISYQIPAFTCGKHTLYISGYKHHIGMYPIHSVEGLDKDMEPYKGGDAKASLHFKHSEPLPVKLIEDIIKAKYKEWQ